MASVVELQIKVEDETRRGFRILNERLDGLNRGVIASNRTRAQQTRDHTSFLVAQYRERVRERQRALREEQAAAERAAAEEERLRRYHQRLVINSRQAEARAAEQSARRQEQAIRRVRRGYDRLVTSVNRYAARAAAITVFGAVGAAGGVLRDAIAYEGIIDGLTALEGSAQAAQARLASLRRVIEQPGVEYRAAVQAVVELKAVGVEGDLANRVIREFGNSLALVGRTDLRLTLLGLRQIISRGRVSQEELNQITERSSLLSEVLRRQFGTVLSEPIQAQVERSGRGIIGGFLIPIVEGLERLERAPVGSALNSLQNLRNAVFELNATLGVQILPRFSEQVQRLTQFIQDNANRIQPAFQRISDIAFNAFGEVLNIVDRVITRFDDFINIIQGGLTAGLALSFSRVLTNAAFGLNTFTQNLNAASVAGTSFIANTFGVNTASSVARFTRVLSLASAGVAAFSGVLGAIALGGAVYSIFKVLSDDTESAANSIENLNRSLQQTTRRLEEIESVQQRLRDLSPPGALTEISTLQRTQQSTLNFLAEQLNLETPEQFIARLQQSSGVRVSRERALERLDVVSPEELLSLTSERITGLEQERAELALFPSANAARIESINTEIDALSQRLEVYNKSSETIRRLQGDFRNLLDAQRSLTNQQVTDPFAITDADARRNAGFFATLGARLDDFRERLPQIGQSFDRNIRRPLQEIEDAAEVPNVLISRLNILNRPVSPRVLREETERLRREANERAGRTPPSLYPTVRDTVSENRAFESVFQGIQTLTDRFHDTFGLLESLSTQFGRSVQERFGEPQPQEDPAAPFRERQRRYEQQLREAFANRITNLGTGLASNLTTNLIGEGLFRNSARDRNRQLEDLNRERQRAIAEINRNEELSEQEKEERITAIHRQAAEQRALIDTQYQRQRIDSINAILQSFTQALGQELIQFAAAQAQKALIARLTDTAILSSAALTTLGTVAGIALPVAGAALLLGNLFDGRLFHDPVNDRDARRLGAELQQQIQQNNRVSAQDFLQNVQVGFESENQQERVSERDSGDPRGGTTDQPVQVIVQGQNFANEVLKAISEQTDRLVLTGIIKKKT